MAYHKRAIGIVRTGMLDDGAAGLWEIKNRGGLAVVQDPDDAVCPAVPVSAMQRAGLSEYLAPRVGIVDRERLAHQAEDQRRNADTVRHMIEERKAAGYV